MGREDPKDTDQDTRPKTGSSAPPKKDPSGRPLTDDERIDEAIRESFGTSDPPAHSSPDRVGAPPKRKQDKNKKSD